MIYIWTDGSCRNKTKDKGGYGIVVRYGKSEEHISGGSYINTTSARMEIRGVLEALRYIEDKALPVKIYSDNQYVVKSITERWCYNWKTNNWSDGKGGKRINHDLWIQVIDELSKFETQPILEWVRGHDGNEYNEVADQLAGKGAKNEEIIDDSTTI
jgi:ribonuclease HI